jgi:hypothetical protein
MANKWETLSKFVTINSPWMTLIGEKIKDHQGKILDYWRVEKDDSVIIITIDNNQLLFPLSIFRPGVGKVTLDFPGGRIQKQQNLQEVAVAILERELGLKESDLDSLTPINHTGWEINSSFSNQKLYGFVAEIKPNIQLNSNLVGASYSLNAEGLNNLLKELTCVQCRGLLLEWLRTIDNQRLQLRSS